MQNVTEVSQTTILLEDPVQTSNSRKLEGCILLTFLFVGLCVNFLIVLPDCQMENANTTKIKLKTKNE